MNVGHIRGIDVHVHIQIDGHGRRGLSIAA